MAALTKAQLRKFAQRGFLVVPGVVHDDLRDAAAREIDRMMEQEPPPADRRGFHFYWVNDLARPNPLLALIVDSGVADLAQSLIAPLELTRPREAQVSLNIPPWNHRPGGPHLDGLTPPEPSGRPGTFTMLAGVFLTDQTEPDMGNLWVWPESHRVGAAYLRRHGPEALLGIPHPAYPMAPPEQVMGRAGDVYLAHYLLGHNMGGNLSARTRRVVYFRLHSAAHVEHWRDYVQDELLEFAPARLAMTS